MNAPSRRPNAPSRRPRIVDLTLPVESGMPGIPKIPFYDQYPVKVQAVTLVSEEQRAFLQSRRVDVAPAAARWAPVRRRQPAGVSSLEQPRTI